MLWPEIKHTVNRANITNITEVSSTLEVKQEIHSAPEYFDICITFMYQCLSDKLVSSQFRISCWSHRFSELPWYFVSFFIPGIRKVRVCHNMCYVFHFRISIALQTYYYHHLYIHCKKFH